jgi:hypothetical protein
MKYVRYSRGLMKTTQGDQIIKALLRIAKFAVAILEKLKKGEPI